MVLGRRGTNVASGGKPYRYEAVVTLYLLCLLAPVEPVVKDHIPPSGRPILRSGTRHACETHFEPRVRTYLRLFRPPEARAFPILNIVALPPETHDA